MIPISDENPTLRMPIVTIVLIALNVAVWLFIQKAGFDAYALAASVCNLGLVAGELTGLARVGMEIPMGEGIACIVDREPINMVTPVTSMFLHGSWGHLIGNMLFLWVFGNNIEDSMGRFRFIVFYMLCGFAAAGAQIAINPSSPVPMVGASGAISGVLGGYLILYPKVRVNMLFIIFIFIRIIPLPAWLVLLWWFGLQVVLGLPQLSSVRPDISSGVAVWAHIGGFVAGVLLVKIFENRARVRERSHPRPHAQLKLRW